MINTHITITQDEKVWVIEERKEKMECEIVNSSTDEVYEGTILSINSRGTYEILLHTKTYEKPNRPRI